MYGWLLLDFYTEDERGDRIFFSLTCNHDGDDFCKDKKNGRTMQRLQFRVLSKIRQN